MNAEVALFWVQEALQLAILVSAPLLLAALAIGLLVSLVQAVTSIQEMTLSYIPKILIVAAVLFVLAPWMLQLLIDFTTHIFESIPRVSR